MNAPPLPAALRARLPVWLATPWVDRGESLAGWDCWGLVVVVSGEAFGRRLPNLAALVNSALNRADVAAAVRCGLPWFVAGPPAAGAVALFAVRGEAVHVGLYLTERLVLHAQAGVGTRLLDLADLSGAAYAARLRGAFHLVETSA